jgi:hypothetical protein
MYMIDRCSEKKLSQKPILMMGLNMKFYVKLEKNTSISMVLYHLNLLNFILNNIYVNLTIHTHF